MPIIKTHNVFELARRVKVFFTLGAGVTRGEVPELRGAQAGQFSPPAPENLQKLRKALERTQRQLDAKERENYKLRAGLVPRADGSGGISPDRMTWIFGSGRSGSSWLADMMTSLDGYTQWNEPYVGALFGNLYYLHVGEHMRSREEFIMGAVYREAWLNSIRRFVLEAANVRFPDLADGGHLVIKEPNGSVGTPIIMEALPESRLILLVRDPRDVVSSALAAQRKGSWGNQWRPDGHRAESLADTDPDRFVWQWTNGYMSNISKAREAYETHTGPKVMVRYEDLRYQTLETMRRIYAGLGLPADERQLQKVVEKHAWENIPTEKKGADKPQRKAQPGGWREDLTPGQAGAVEKITAPILEEFYSESFSGSTGAKTAK